ncbi:MAG: hypothetical protein V1916_01240, partial [Patescibacteria group bacterium]
MLVCLLRSCNQMRLSRDAKLFIVFIAVYLCLAWGLTHVYLLTHVREVSVGWDAWHERIRAGTIGDSNQFRLLSFWMAEGIGRAFVQPPFAAYLMLRFFCTFITFSLFHLFLLKWFRHQTALLSVLLLAAFTPLTYLPFLQEADVVLLPLFLVGLWLIREHWLLPFAVLLAVATFAKETAIFLIPFYLLYRWDRTRWLRTVLETVGLLAVWAAAFYVTRNVFYHGHNS